MNVTDQVRQIVAITASVRSADLTAADAAALRAAAKGLLAFLPAPQAPAPVGPQQPTDQAVRRDVLAKAKALRIPVTRGMPTADIQAAINIKIRSKYTGLRKG
ncbi:hypothetical protein [Micromonospora sp. WMMD1082]|uniref:hypothetical protein n=1 Tax=Micromonospora sp. WMMD1082 TaxID=3016104 RepID=UPI002416FC7C|nr:hypothetical protein [Micromonospora sp. WMMD1082]MDG4796231.1 hypothetical protein [Micromonospora sp. WMMD1082]